MARIYKLIGVREDVTYEEAIEIAKYAAGLIGIRPALLLGILSQESNIKNALSAIKRLRVMIQETLVGVMIIN
jgi:hypothetical protein